MQEEEYKGLKLADMKDAVPSTEQQEQAGRLRNLII
jgi:hypothetical protein